MRCVTICSPILAVLYFFPDGELVLAEEAEECGDERYEQKSEHAEERIAGVYHNEGQERMDAEIFANDARLGELTDNLTHKKEYQKRYSEIGVAGGE